MLESRDDFATLFLNDVPLLDVRAPVEFAQGSFPGALNRPLMNDDERHQVGTCYKQQGSAAAVELGHTLVSGAVKAERVAAWKAFAKAHPDGVLYCFRGGLRSQISQQWLHEAGIDYPRVNGGYKALRTFLMDTTEQAVATCDFVVLGGMTGTGKTDLLPHLRHSVDLEQHANHRGSSFGKQLTPQPSQIDFEHRLAIDFLKKRAAGLSRLVVEDESRAIGSSHLPQSLHRRMQESPVVWLVAPLEERVDRILRDYVTTPCQAYVAQQGEEAGTNLFQSWLQQCLSNLHKRLGGERCQRLTQHMQDAFALQQKTGDTSGHRRWIEGLLREYYDPMYLYQQECKADRIAFTGEAAAVLDYLKA